jgi:hypothetical protein
MLTNEQFREIFDRIVGSAEEFPYDFMSYQDNVSEDSTVEEAEAVAQTLKEVIDESQYEE